MAKKRKKIPTKGEGKEKSLFPFTVEKKKNWDNCQEGIMKGGLKQRKDTQNNQVSRK